MIHVHPTGEQTYVVLTDPRQTVSLRDWNWNGSCTCRCFREVCEPLMRANAKGPQRCDHILAVREWVMDNEYPALVSEQRGKIVPMPGQKVVGL